MTVTTVLLEVAPRMNAARSGVCLGVILGNTDKALAR